MTSSHPLTFPLVSEPNQEKKKQKSRRYRSPQEVSIILQPREREVLKDLFLFGFAPAQASYLTAYHFTKKGDFNGMRNFVANRLPMLWQHGYMMRIQTRTSAYISGSPFPLYCIEDGKASGVSELKIKRRRLSDEQWETIKEESESIRERVIPTLISLGFDADEVKKAVHNTTDLAIKLISGEPTVVWHKRLAAVFLSIIFFGARERGIEPGHLLRDGLVDFSYDEFILDRNDQKAKDDRGNERTKKVVIEPDFFFSLGNDGYALEAETGSSGRAKIEEKVKNYLKLWKLHGIDGVRVPVGAPDLKSFRVIFFCDGAAHAKMVTDVIANAAPKGTGLFLVCDTREITLGDEDEGELWTRETFIRNLPTASGTPLYTHLAARISSPIFTCVTGKTMKGATTKLLPLL